MPGYEVIAVGRLNTRLVCPECDLVLKEAVQSYEGDRLCESCFQDISKQPNHKSRKTGLSVTGDDGKPLRFPDKLVRHEVQQLKVQCNNWIAGCKWVGQLGSYFKEHEQQCRYKPKPCPDCGEMINPDKMDRHRSEECRFRKDQCEYCGKKLAHNKMQEHHKSCKKYPLRCEHCQDEVPRENMKRHIDEECRHIKCSCGEVGAAAGDAFREHRADLLDAVTDVHILANSLYSKGVISREQLEHAELETLTPNQRKLPLFDAIEARLRSNPYDIYALLDILRTDPLLQIFWKKIWSSYLKKKAFHLYQKNLQKTSSFIFKTKFDDENAPLNEECVETDESVKKESLLSGVRRGIRKLFGAARNMTANFIKSTLCALKLDIKILRKCKKRFDKHTDREQVRWWFEIWGDESALKALESKWEEVSAKNKWRLETCRPVPPQKC